MNKFYKLYARFFALPILYKWNYMLFRCSLSGLGILNYQNRQISGEKSFINKTLPKYVNKNPVFFDVGGNVGIYSKSLLNIYPNSVIHIFEPHPKNAKVLFNDDFSRNILINDIALSSEKGSFKLFDYSHIEGSSHASVYRGVIENIHKGEATSYLVKKNTLDNYVEEHNIKVIDLLKIDVEGHELNVLEGSKESIKNRKIKIVHFEFNEMNVESRCFMYDFRKKLEDFNFYRLLTTGLLPLKIYKPLTNEIFAYQNIVAIRKDIDKEI